MLASARYRVTGGRVDSRRADGTGPAACTG